MSVTSHKVDTVVRLDAQVAQLAGLRACINQLETRALQAYWCGGDAAYRSLVTIIGQCIGQIRPLAECAAKDASDGCPDGTYECDGICVPIPPRED